MSQDVDTLLTQSAPLVDTSGAIAWGIGLATEVAIPAREEAVRDDEDDEFFRGDDGQLTLLERLDRRQNEVLIELDRLNASIDQLVQQLRNEREPAA